MTHYELCRMEQLQLIKLIDEGKLVYLPCKVGNTVYISGERYPCKIEQIVIDNVNIYFVWASYTRSYELAECWNEGDFDIYDIGKTVFLTLEEAEKALKEREKNGK